MIRTGVVAPILAVRAGLRALLGSGPAPSTPDPGGFWIEVVWEAANLSGLESLPAGLDVLLVTAEAFAPDELSRLLAANPGDLALLLLSDEPPRSETLVALPLRAWGLLALDSTGDELSAAIHALAEGLLVGSPALARPALQRLLRGEVAPGDSPTEALTERESQVLQLLAHGLANKQIAASLGISEHTVKFHVSSIYAKLGVTSRTEAVRTGVQHGLVVL